MENLKISGLDSIRSFSCSLLYIAAPVTTLNVALRAVVHTVLEVEVSLFRRFRSFGELYLASTLVGRVLKTTVVIVIGTAP